MKNTEGREAVIVDMEFVKTFRGNVVMAAMSAMPDTDKVLYMSMMGRRGSAAQVSAAGVVKANVRARQ
jgi:hypothetical protein